MQSTNEINAGTRLLDVQASPNAPIACDMTTARDTPSERFNDYARLFSEALLDRERTENAVTFRFANRPGVAQWVTDLASREAACCPFCSYQVTLHSDHIAWRTSSDAGAAAQAMLDEFHGLPDQISGGLDGMFERLAARGVPIVSREPNRFVIDSPEKAPGLLSKLKAACGC
jgi:hypothetical protein